MTHLVGGGEIDVGIAGGDLREPGVQFRLGADSAAGQAGCRRGLRYRLQWGTLNLIGILALDTDQTGWCVA
jgi:hypothetical protein